MPTILYESVSAVIGNIRAVMCIDVSLSKALSLGQAERLISEETTIWGSLYTVIQLKVQRFALHFFIHMFSDEEQVDLSDYATLSVTDNTLTASSTIDATLFVATYDVDGRMSDVKLTTLYADTPVEVNVVAGQRAYVLDADMSPLCEEIVVG